MQQFLFLSTGRPARTRVASDWAQISSKPDSAKCSLPASIHRQIERAVVPATALASSTRNMETCASHWLHHIRTAPRLRRTKMISSCSTTISILRRAIKA
jgi:hypothetical protein